MPTLKPIYDRHFRRRRNTQRRDKDLSLTVRQMQRQPRYQPLDANQNDGSTASPSSFPIGQPSMMVEGEQRKVYEEHTEASDMESGRCAARREGDV